MSSLPDDPPLTQGNAILEARVFVGTALLGIVHAQRRAYTIGEHPGVDLVVDTDALPADTVALVDHDERGYSMAVWRDMDGEVERGGTVLPLSALSSSELAEADDGERRLALPLDARVVARVGGATVALRFVAAPAPLPRAFLRALDTSYVNTLLVAGLLHVVAIATLLTWPEAPAAFDDGRVERVVALLDARVQTWPCPVVREPERRAPEPPAAPSTSPRVRSRGATVLRPRSIAWSSLVRGALKTDASPAPLGRVVRASVVPIREVGVVPSARGLVGGNVLGGPTSLIPELPAAAPRVAPGLDSLGARATAQPLPAALAAPIVDDALPKALVRRIIDDNRNQLRACYERSLYRRHDLVGRVVLSWRIGPTGEVLAVRLVESSLDDAEAERCLLERVGRWRFPEPRGGGTVDVVYPIVFSAG